MSTIERFAGSARGRSRAVAFDRLVWVVANSTRPGDDFAAQVNETLELLEQALREAGSARSALLSVQVYLVDMAQKPEFDARWNEWIGPAASWPQRVCIEAGLTAGLLVELQAIAARIDGEGAEASSSRG